MFDTAEVVEVRDAVGEWVRELEPGLYAGPNALALLDVVSDVKRLFGDALGKQLRYSSVRQKRPLSAPDAEERTESLGIERCLRSCCESLLGRRTDCLSARQSVDDDHRRGYLRSRRFPISAL